MSDWISVTNTPKKKDQAEEADQQAPLSKAQQKNKKRAEKRRERVEGPRAAARRRSNSSGNLADEDDDDEAPPVAEVEVDVAELHKNSGRRRKPCGRRTTAAKVAAGNADKDLVAKAGRRAALEADEKAARRAVEDADAKHAGAALAELSLLVEAAAAGLVRANLKHKRATCHCGATVALSGLREHLRSCGPDAHMYPPRRKFGHVFKQPAFVDKKKDAPRAFAVTAAEENAMLQAAIAASLAES
ncbi:hypothetical protein JL722_3153 [Aureococcus anophagefferens]|nr:hypothetical protein JL722_3153 [Aureococcus anophagefferens]